MHATCWVWPKIVLHIFTPVLLKLLFLRGQPHIRCMHIYVHVLQMVIIFVQTTLESTFAYLWFTLFSADIDKYLEISQIQSAVKLQAIWRGVLERRKLGLRKATAQQVRAAITIQRYVSKTPYQQLPPFLRFSYPN